jgi:hypothetical protein
MCVEESAEDPFSDFIKIYNATSSLVRFENKNISPYFQQTL